MRRLGIGVFWLAVFFVAASLLIIGYELAFPGVSSIFQALESSYGGAAGWVLFQSAGTTPQVSAASTYSLVIALHHIGGLVACWAIVLMTLRQAGRTGSRAARNLAWIVIACAVTLVLGQILMEFDTGLAILGLGEFGDRLNGQTSGGDAARLLISTIQYPVLMCFAIAGTALMIARTVPESRAAGCVVAIALLSGAAHVAGQLDLMGWALTSIALTPAGLALLAYCAFLQSDGDRRGVAYLLLGAVSFIAGLILVDVQLGRGLRSLQGTMWDNLPIHAGPVGFCILAGFAMLDIRLKPKLQRPVIWAHGAALVAAMATAFLPLGWLGQQGMLGRFIDYPEHFSTANQIATFGSFVLITLIALGVSLMIRHRTPHSVALTSGHLA